MSGVTPYSRRIEEEGLEWSRRLADGRRNALDNSLEDLLNAFAGLCGNFDDICGVYTER